MMSFLEAIHTLFPIFGILILGFGILSQRKNYIILALWLSLIALFLHYRASGGEILGSYFNYSHAAIYSLNLVVLVVALLYLLLNASKGMSSKLLRLGSALFSAGLITGSALLLVNLWVNASFVENRLAGTPILQVAAFNKQAYCGYKYIFYKVGADNKVRFMCPNHYGLMPSIGRLDSAPAYVVKQLPNQFQTKFTNER
ncbi:MAG: type I secretion system protein LssZ [Tatlockia sp.]|jgi:hypothetical protein